MKLPYPGVWKRVNGLIRQEIFLTYRRLEILMDIVFFPMMNVILFGYITAYIGGSGNIRGDYFILGVLLWEFVVIMQYNVSVSSMWSMWSHNLTNMFIAPISVGEYLLAQFLAAVLRTVAVIGILCLGALFVFHFNILQLGAVNLVLFALNLTLFSYWLGIIVLGMVFRFGQRIQAITWYTVFIFQPLTAAFFPASVLPGFLQGVAYALPPTYVFEAARQTLAHGGVNWRYAGISLGLNVLFLAMSVAVFMLLFRGSKTSGQFARNDL